MLSCFIVIIVLTIQNSNHKKQGVLINEIRSTDASAYRDGYYGSDYIELYNQSEETISLDSWYLSDDESNLMKSKIAEMEIAPKSYVVLFADCGENENSLNFKISSEGEKIFLSNSKGELVDSVLVPALRYGESYARISDGNQKWAVMTESFEEKNDSALIVQECTLNSPVFSHESGFYENEFELQIRGDFGQQIYYTLDGSVPSKDSIKYTGPIIIENITEQPNRIRSVRNVLTNWKDWEPSSELEDKATVVRAISVDKYNHVSKIVTKTYFVNLPQYENKNIVSVVAEFNDLFGENGIFVTGKEFDEAYLSGSENLPEPNFTQSGRKWEVLGNFEFFQNGQEICNQLAGIRNYGGSSRHGKIKRMSLYARKEYDGSEYFEGFSLAERNVHSMGTNNSIGNLIFPQLLLDRLVAVQGIERAEVFLNGEYYSNTDLIEKYSKQYFEQRYGVSRDNILVMKDGEVSEGPEEAELFYKWLQKQAFTQDLSISEHYQEVQQLMDIQSYIDYICANVYLCNMDVSQVKNYMCWRSIENDGTQYGDTRFRWMLYDMGALDDQISLTYYGVESKAAVNSFSTKGRYVGHSINDQELYKALKANETYRKQFVLSFMDMANVNFAVENVKKVFEHWGYSTELYGDFFEKRFEYIVPYLAEEFDLAGTLETVTLKINHASAGTIQINTTVPNLENGEWIGKYYTDYPITVTAIPKDGYRFVGWNGTFISDNDTIEVNVLPGGITLEAVFEKTAN